MKDKTPPRPLTPLHVAGGPFCIWCRKPFTNPDPTATACSVRCTRAFVIHESSKKWRKT